MDDLGHTFEASETLGERPVKEVREGVNKGEVGDVFLLRPPPKSLDALPLSDQRLRLPLIAAPYFLWIARHSSFIYYWQQLTIC